MAELGRKIGDGATAEVFEYGEGRVLKLARPGFDRAVMEHEARTTKAAFEAGAPAPEVFDLLEVDGRLGIVYPRYEGEPLVNKLVRREVTPEQVGVTMAQVHHSLHAAAYRGELVTFRGWVNYNLGNLEKKGTPADVLASVRGIVAELPESGPVTHCDLHAGNILMTADGPVIIDWISALSADPMVDLARQHLSLTVLPIEDPHPAVQALDVLRPRVDAAFFEAYAGLSGTSVAALLERVAPYMPVMAALRMAEPVCTPLETEILTKFIRTYEG